MLIKITLVGSKIIEVRQLLHKKYRNDVSLNCKRVATPKEWQKVKKDVNWRKIKSIYLKQIFLRFDEILEDSLDYILVVKCLDIMDQTGRQNQLWLDFRKASIPGFNFQSNWSGFYLEETKSFTQNKIIVRKCFIWLILNVQ